MIACDFCSNWFFCACISLSQENIEAIDVYACTLCQATGKSVKCRHFSSHSIESQQITIAKRRKELMLQETLPHYKM